MARKTSQLEAAELAEHKALEEAFGVSADELGVNDYGWLRIFNEPRFRDEFEAKGYFFITAEEVNRIGRREARLMAKHDSSTSRPWIFKKHGLSIVSVRWGEYLVGRFNLYAPLPELTEPVLTMSIPAGFESLDFTAINSEATALNAAHLAGILQHFLGEPQLHSTVSGRMKTANFDFDIQLGGEAFEVLVDSAQMEIDAGYESPRAVYLVEAKNRPLQDFNVRQVYYPWAVFNRRTGKPTKAIYLLFVQDIFHLYEFAFTNPRDPSSIEFVRGARYALTPNLIDEAAIRSVVENILVRPEPASVPFPQANSLAKIIALCDAAVAQPLTAQDVSETIEMVGHQAHYHAKAASYLGFLEGNAMGYQLTARGRAVFEGTSRTAKLRGIVEALAEHEAFRAVLQACLDQGGCPSTAEIVEILSPIGILGRGGKPLSDVTLHRRANTVRAWCSTIWELAHQEEIALD